MSVVYPKLVKVNLLILALKIIVDLGTKVQSLVTKVAILMP